MFVQRNYDRTEEDDWKLNVQNQLQNGKQSTEVRHEGKIVGWKIINAYE